MSLWSRIFPKPVPVPVIAKAAGPTPVAAVANEPAPAPPLLRIIQPQARDRWTSALINHYTPDRIVSVLRGALVSGSVYEQWELFNLMEDTWPRLTKNFNELKRAVQAVEWTVQSYAEKGSEPTSSAQERAKLVESVIWSMRPDPAADENDFDSTIYDILDAWGKGISVLEIDWEIRPDVIAPRCTRWIKPNYYGYPSNGSKLSLNTREQGITLPAGTVSDVWAPFPANKFLLGVCKHKTGHPIGAALLRSLAWWWCAANFGADWLLNYAQLFGQPLRYATYDPNQPNLLEQLSEMLENMGSAGWAAFPMGTTFDLKEASKSGGDNPQTFLLSLADKTADILILGQTLTTDVGASGSRALGEVHQAVRADIIISAGNWAAGVLEQLCRAILILNYGDDSECPWFDPTLLEVKDAVGMAQRDQTISGMGVDLPKNWFYARHGIPLPADGEEVIPGHVGAPAGSGGGAGSLPPIQAKDASSKLADNVLENLTGVEAKWLGGLKPFYQNLIQAAQSRSVTDAEFTRVLETSIRQHPELFKNFDTQVLQSAMEEAMGAAVVNGAVNGFMRRRGVRRAA